MQVGGSGADAFPILHWCFDLGREGGGIFLPQLEHWQTGERYSVTSTLISMGRSKTCRCVSPQLQRAGGGRSTTWSGSLLFRRVVPLWPGWAPGFFFLPFLPALLGGGDPPELCLSEEGGFELLWLSLPSLALSAAICSPCAAIVAACSSILAASCSTFSQSIRIISAALSGSLRHIATSPRGLGRKAEIHTRLHTMTTKSGPSLISRNVKKVLGHLNGYT